MMEYEVLTRAFRNLPPGSWNCARKSREVGSQHGTAPGVEPLRQGQFVHRLLIGDMLFVTAIDQKSTVK
jgi:hypothetical protein